MPLCIHTQDNLLLLLDLLPLPCKKAVKTHEPPNLDARARFREFFVIMLPLLHLFEQLPLACTRLLQFSHGFGKGNFRLFLFHARHLKEGFKLKSKFFHVSSSADAGCFPVSSTSRRSVSS